jgi:DNA polymerase-3 subunit alpha
MEKFAGYGFNKSHAAAYSLLAYHTAWIKVHCTAEFYAANMTIEPTTPTS